MSENSEIRDLTKLHEWLLGAELLSAIKDERYNAAERIRRELKRRLDNGTINDQLFGEMVRSKKLTSVIDPTGFFRD